MDRVNDALDEGMVAELAERGGNSMKIAIRITGARAIGKSTVAHTIAGILRRNGFTNITMMNVDPAKPWRLAPQQLDAAVTVIEALL